jgi:hypothetical protein
MTLPGMINVTGVSMWLKKSAIQVRQDLVLLHVSAELVGDNSMEQVALYFSSFDDSHFILYVDGVMVDTSALLAANVTMGNSTSNSTSEPSIGSRIGAFEIPTPAPPEGGAFGR